MRVRAIVEQAGIFRPDEVEVALEVFQDAVTAPGKDYCALGAYDDDQLVGFACYGLTPCTVATWDLYWIAVDPRSFRQGVGRQLMSACEEQIRTSGGRLVVVETASRPDYAATRAFYEALGYAPAAHIPEYYAPDDDLIVFVKYLRPSTQEMAHHG
jgi:ribosomal protein S18 acetylase RimI-like enzyme